MSCYESHSIQCYFLHKALISHGMQDNKHMKILNLLVVSVAEFNVSPLVESLQFSQLLVQVFEKI